MTDIAPVTHADLVRRAESWLRNTAGCALVATELCGFVLRESPDAFGLRVPEARHTPGLGTPPPDYTSIVVECKTSLSDFYSDRSKGHRKDGGGAGALRYYMVPKGLIEPARVPDGWGLLVTCGQWARCVKEAERRELSPERARDEIALLYTMLRRGVANYIESGDTHE